MWRAVSSLFHATAVPLHGLIEQVATQEIHFQGPASLILQAVSMGCESLLLPRRPHCEEWGDLCNDTLWDERLKAVQEEATHFFSRVISNAMEIQRTKWLVEH